MYFAIDWLGQCCCFFTVLNSDLLLLQRKFVSMHVLVDNSIICKTLVIFYFSLYNYWWLNSCLRKMLVYIMDEWKLNEQAVDM